MKTMYLDPHVQSFFYIDGQGTERVRMWMPVVRRSGRRGWLWAVGPLEQLVWVRWKGDEAPSTELAVDVLTFPAYFSSRLGQRARHRQLCGQGCTWEDWQVVDMITIEGFFVNTEGEGAYFEELEWEDGYETL